MSTPRSAPLALRLTLPVLATALLSSAATAWLARTPAIDMSVWRVVLALALVGAAMAASIAIGLRLVRRPVQAVAAQMRAQSRAPADGLRPIELPAPASDEARELADAFNALVHAQRAREMQRRHALAGLSHDLRKPLTRLQLRAAIALPEATTQLMDADFDAMDRLIFQVGRLTTDDANAFRAGQMLPLRDIVEQVVARYRDLDDVRIDVQMPPELPPETPHYPDLALDRLLANLIDNALTHGQAPVEVRVEVVSESSPDRQAHTTRLLVFDSGRGIDPLHRASLESRLARADLDTLVRGARGMGLSIVEQIARQLDGELIVLPYDGYRSAVGVLLPWPDAPVSGRSVRTAAPDAAGAAPHPAPHRTS